jgi:hypothetical protein
MLKNSGVCYFGLKNYKKAAENIEKYIEIKKNDV